MTYLAQFYNEGFGYLLYYMPVKYLKNKIKNKSIFNIIRFVIMFTYTIFILLLAFLLFCFQFPFDII